MPGNLAVANPSGVLPQTLSTSFSTQEQFPVLDNRYHDGTNENGLISDGVNVPEPLRVWKLSKRLTHTQVQALRVFFEGQSAGQIPFYWYNPFEPFPGQPIGSNYDPTGVSTQGRHTVVFRGNWMETTDAARTNADIELVEVA